MTRPFSIRIFLPGGDPDGLRVVEKSNWTGVYFLVGNAGDRWNPITSDQKGSTEI